MKSMNYYCTFIRVAEDSPATKATPPASRGEKPTVAELEYELLSQSPSKFTQEELLFEVHVRRLGLTKGEVKAKRKALWEEFFSKSRACLRTSALAKRYGWGLHFDAAGLIRLVPMESAEYKKLAKGKEEGLTVVNAMRSKRQ